LTVEVRFLGAGDAFGSHGRLQACIMLSGAGEPLLLDCGMTSMAAMKRAGVDPAEIGYVLVSHHHGDHFGGLPLMILEGQTTGRTKPLTVAGPPATEERVWRLMDAAYPGTADRPRAFEVTFVEYSERQPLEVGPTTVTPFTMNHSAGPSPAFGVRVEYGGRTVAYTGDTAWTEALLDLSREADLLINECTMNEREVSNHLSYPRLLEGLAGHPVGRVILTHVGPELLEHRAALEFEVAEEGMAIAL
jgi:ribonuclease BN (tRNA processing enzyme)